MTREGVKQKLKMKLKYINTVKNRINKINLRSEATNSIKGRNI